MISQRRRSDEVEQVVRRMPGWAEVELTVTPLSGGITNRNYRVDVDGHAYVVRIPGERTEVLGIDRANEAEAAERAAALGVAPAVLGELPGVGTLVTELVAGEHFSLDDPARLATAVDALRRFHHSGPLAGAFPIHRVVEWHARDAVAHGVGLPPTYERLHERSSAIEAAFAAHPIPPAPCHNDLLPANLLFDATKVWLLDFEYAGMNDVFFDLGNLSVNSGFDDELDHLLLSLYFGDVTNTAWARLQLMKMMSELREGMWGVVQQGISTLTTIDFRAYATERLDSCDRIASSAELARWLQQAAAPLGPTATLR